MKTSILKLAGAMLAAVALTSIASAGLINGSITFKADGATTDTGDLATATAYTGFYGVQVSTGIFNAPTGSYAGTDGTAVTFAPFSFSASSVANLWKFNFGGNWYSFDATSVSIHSQDAQFLNIRGSGTAYITGYDPTPGTWSVTSTKDGGSITFSAATTVPDGGMTALLLGAGLLSLGVAARRKRA